MFGRVVDCFVVGFELAGVWMVIRWLVGGGMVGRVASWFDVRWWL